MVDYSELKRLAEAATKGKWCTDGGRQVMSAESDQLNSGFVIVDCQGPDNLKNAAFVAAAGPAAILALIAELKKIDADRKACWAEFKVQGRQVDQLKTDNDLLRDGLHDIAKKASESRSFTRRLTWIEGRAESALLGKQWAAHVFMMPDPKNGKPKAERLEAENKQLKAENEALRKDADRYRWLRDKSESIHQFYLSTPIWFTGVKFSKDNVDGTIDAAMGKGEQANG